MLNWILKLFGFDKPPYETEVKPPVVEPVPVKEYFACELAKLKKAEVVEIAKEVGVDFCKKTKAQLIELIAKK